MRWFLAWDGWGVLIIAHIFPIYIFYYLGTPGRADGQIDVVEG